MNKRTTILSAIAAAVSLVGVSVAAAAPSVAMAQAVAETYIDSNGVFHYAYAPVERPGAVLETDIGLFAKDGSCLFRGAGVGVTGDQRVVIVDEVSFDPASCSRTLSVATYPLDAVPDRVRRSLQPQAGTLETSTSSSGSMAVAALVTSWSQKLSTWVGDPVGIHVSETKIQRSWNSAGGWNNVHNWGWYSPTGWSKTAQSQIDSLTLGDTRGTFVNWAFCNPFASTTDTHYETRLTTSVFGDWSWSYSMVKSGDCSDLLSYHYVLGG